MYPDPTSFIASPRLSAWLWVQLKGSLRSFWQRTKHRLYRLQPDRGFEWSVRKCSFRKAQGWLVHTFVSVALAATETTATTATTTSLGQVFALHNVASDARRNSAKQSWVTVVSMFWSFLFFCLLWAQPLQMCQPAFWAHTHESMTLSILQPFTVA